MSPRSHTRSTPSTLVALALCCGASAAHAVVVVEAIGSGYVSGDNASTRLAMEVTQLASAGGRSASGARELRITSAADVFAGATISGSSFAAPGVLKAKIDGLAFVTPVAPNVPTISNGTPVAAGGFSGRFEDAVLLSSATLAAGTPVQFVYTVDLHATSNGAGHAGPQFSGYDSGSFYFHYFLRSSSGGAAIDTMYHYPNGLYQKVPGSSFRFPITVSGVIGEVVAFGAEISLGADDRAGWYGDGAGNLSWYGDVQETHLDASNTARFYLDAFTPGLDLLAESGHNYATSAVPEPGSWILLALGLGTLGGIMRRQARPAP
ncbi:PEP-CTERM sorting domain-containing protein [Pelomonas sp. Root1444]|uniref:PEP-CTERM sorting domain-containing protein n=1 Tax=Pelomonas sp. Root1444 TaxID=1736464 RepID=UPI0009EB80B8|nr:PEP-CTERM sorting domain-containing protein [Pelomonas sp. Root1444]